jgi:hypothetical protein
MGNVPCWSAFLKNVAIVLCAALIGNAVWYGSLLIWNVVNVVYRDHMNLVKERDDWKDKALPKRTIEMLHFRQRSLLS